MTDQIPQPGQTTQPQEPSYPAGQRREGHSGHGLMMIACSLPILVLGILVFTGVVGSGALLYAVFCMLMMGVMMFAMSRMQRR